MLLFIVDCCYCTLYMARIECVVAGGRSRIYCVLVVNNAYVYPSRGGAGLYDKSLASAALRLACFARVSWSLIHFISSKRTFIYTICLIV